MEDIGQSTLLLGEMSEARQVERTIAEGGLILIMDLEEAITSLKETLEEL